MAAIKTLSKYEGDPVVKRKKERERKKERKPGDWHQNTVLRNVSPFYRVKERKCGGPGGRRGGGQRSRRCGGRRRKQRHRSELGGVWRGGDLCGCKMGLFPPLWGSSCKPALHAFNWADIYTVAQKQASFSTTASHPSPSASQTQPKVKSIFFKTASLYFSTSPACPLALPSCPWGVQLSTSLTSLSYECLTESLQAAGIWILLRVSTSRRQLNSLATHLHLTECSVPFPKLPATFFSFPRQTHNRLIKFKPNKTKHLFGFY